MEIRDKVPLLLVRALLDQSLLKQLPPTKRLLLLFTEGNRRAQRYLLGGLEQLIVDPRFKEELLPKVPMVLKCLYDEDIVEEETILEWGKKVKNTLPMP